MGKQIFSRIRLVYRRSSVAVKCVVLTAIILCSATLVIMGITINQQRVKLAEAQARAAELEQENSRLQQNIDELGTPESTQRIAREEAGLVPTDTVIFETTE